MKLLLPLYEKVLIWARHRHASRYLAVLSFAESSFFPIPPDVMLAPMVLAQRQRAWRLALITTAASVVGGLLGYVIGYFAIDIIMPYVEQLGYQASYNHARDLFDQWGWWIIFLAGFSPVPYKLFTISAGAAGMMILPFLLASLVGRGMRFFLVAGLIYFGGEKIEGLLRRYIDIMGWVLVVIAVAGYLLLKN